MRKIKKNGKVFFPKRKTSREVAKKCGEEGGGEEERDGEEERSVEGTNLKLVFSKIFSLGL